MQCYEKYRAILKGLRLMDDDFMCKVFEDEPVLTEYLLSILLEGRRFTVTEVKTQYEIKSVSGRSVRLDILATDSDGTLCDIEIQRSDKGASEQRARYYASFLDTRQLNPGEDFSKIKDTYVIFITEHDHFGTGNPITHIERIVQETGKPFGDGSHILYINGDYTDEQTAIGRLMHDFRCTDVREMHPSPLQSKVAYLKNDERGAESMCKIIEQLVTESELRGEKRGELRGELRGEKRGELRGQASGRKIGRDETILKMVQSGLLTKAQIAAACGVPEELVEELSAGQ